MPVGVQLSQLRRLLRAETGQTLNVAQGSNAQGLYDIMLERTQQELWESYEWPHLRFTVDMPLATGQRYYSYPAGITFESVNRVWCQDGQQWLPVKYGIDVPDYGANGGEDARAFPVRHWSNRVEIVSGKVVPAGKIEVLPVPSKDGVLRFVAQAKPNALQADADICVLDSTLIVLYAAAEILAAQKAENAGLKLQKAQQYLRRLFANQSADKREITVLGGAAIADTYSGTPSGRRFRIPGE